ncbi:MAG TPA: phosphoribosylamine--glycine ligase [Nitrospinae bacterium]|nr:phosphoribosylamine--glycine ligase [Nitrospinota bacterium]HBA26486.1 phosphoribosylamine--glycine ligase [Nitrospinota bacterium]
MKILIIGNGGREHALVWKISKSPLVKKVYCAPGNAGTSDVAENVNIESTDIKGLVEFAVNNSINLTVVGPELPLTLGIVNEFEKRGLKIFGPSKEAAEIEGSKVFAKYMMKKYKIPTAKYESFNSQKDAKDYILSFQPSAFSFQPVVIKADGLAAGKGVIICNTIEEAVNAVDLIMVEKVFGSAGMKIIIEEYLKGEEASFMVFSDGEEIVPLASAQDHKQIYDGDKGPNTGGMGAYSPAPVITDSISKEIIDTIIRPLISGMKEERKTYKGILYAGLMIVNSKPFVLEFNCRFGDPETQPILMRMKNDIVPIMMSVVDGKLKGKEIQWGNEPSVCVVMAANGYPDKYEKGKEIGGLDEAKNIENLRVFHAGTSKIKDKVVTNGGRVIGVTSLGANFEDAIDRAYKGVSLIKWDGVYYRRDIGRKAIPISRKSLDI